MITTSTWIVFLVIGVVEAILTPRPTHDEQVQQKLSLVSLGLNTGIARTIMEYFKNSFQTWKFVEKQKKIRESIRNTDRLTQQDNTVPLIQKQTIIN